MKRRNEERVFKAFKSGRDLAPAWLLAACGGGSDGGEVTSTTSSKSGFGASGLPPSYTPPPSTYSQPSTKDPYSFALAAPVANAYWVDSLDSFASDRIPTLDASSKKYTFTYQFPRVVPTTYVGTDYEIGWKPASDAVQAAYFQIFDQLESMFQIRFVPGLDVYRIHDIVISHADLDLNIAGYGFFPDSYDPLGSDILIDNDFSNPVRIGSTTNFDFEALVHELGHAIGLKHPFEKYNAGDATLNSREDNTAWSAMSYVEADGSYDGKYRPFDLMALADIFGVNPSYRSGDDIYSFSKTGPSFILDGGGEDTVSAAGETTPVFIDLREGCHSYIGAKSTYISSPGQLTIAASSVIENAIGGRSTDYLVGNSYSNKLWGGDGDDAIFAGDGADIVDGGRGSDTIDLSENSPISDLLVLDVSNSGVDMVYSFEQGISGDKIDVKGKNLTYLTSVVSENNVPVSDLFNVVLRLTGDLDSEIELSAALGDSGGFGNINITAGGEILVVTAASQQTGEKQNLFFVKSLLDDLDVTLLATFSGNYLDIDSWSSQNFV